MPDPLTFIASLPAIQSAIALDGTGDGARIKLDVPRSDTDAVLVLQRWYSGVTFKVTIEPVETDGRLTPDKPRKIHI